MPRDLKCGLCGFAHVALASVHIAVTAVILGVLPPALSAPTKPSQKICKTLSAELLFFGQEITRNDTVKRLDRAVIDWRSRPENEQAKEIKRTVTCSLAISLLNEYHCKAEATLCK